MNLTPIHVTIDGHVFNAHLWDNATARDLISRLPLTLEFTDYNDQEKIGNLETPLSMEGMPKGDDPEPADIGWYQPGNTIVFYHTNVGYWGGLARIGHFDDPIDPIKTRTNFTATIELAP